METNDLKNLYVFKVFTDTPLSCVLTTQYLQLTYTSYNTVPNVRIPEKGEKAEGVRELRHQQVGGKAAI